MLEIFIFFNYYMNNRILIFDLNLAQKLKFQKTCQNPFYKSFRVVLCKKPLSKTLNIREMRPFWKSASSKGYSPCKVLTFGRKLQFQKTCQNPLYKSFRVVLCKKLLQKNIKYSRNAIILKIGQQLYYIAHAKSSLWVKNYNSKKDVKIYATNHWEMFSGKNRSKKTLNIRETSSFWKSAIKQRL